MTATHVRRGDLTALLIESELVGAGSVLLGVHALESPPTTI